jgi:hypothetical protein
MTGVPILASWQEEGLSPNLHVQAASEDKDIACHAVGYFRRGKVAEP